MLTRRILPPEEWSKLITAQIQPYASGGLPDPTHWRILVVERDGAIVATAALFDTVHWDYFTIVDAEQGNPVVVKDLVEVGVETMMAYGIDTVHTTIPEARPDLQSMLERLGFERVPGLLYYFRRGA